MLEKRMIVGAFQCNCRLLACSRTGDAVLIDAGDEPAKILQGLEGVVTSQGVPVRVRYLLHTHGHLDHIGATREVREALSHQIPEAPIIALHRGDEPLYKDLKKQGRFFGMNFEDPLPVDHYLEDGEELKVGDLKFSILHTPGHSPGSVCIRLHEDSAAQTTESLFSGDTLFRGSVGRTDLWGGDQDTLFSSIRGRLLTLDGDTRVCPGHGLDTTISLEKQQNPFLR